MSRPSSRIPEHRDQPQHRRARTIPPPHNRVRFWLPHTLVLIVLVLIIVTWSSRIQRGSREGVISFPSHTMIRKASLPMSTHTLPAVATRRVGKTAACTCGQSRMNMPSIPASTAPFKLPTVQVLPMQLRSR